MAGYNVRGIRIGTLNGYFCAIRKGYSEIALNNRSGETPMLNPVEHLDSEQFIGNAKFFVIPFKPCQTPDNQPFFLARLAT